MLLLLVTLLAAGPIMAAETKRIVMLGDSLTAGYGLAAGDELPVRLEEALAAEGVEATVENAGVSGDTTAGGLSRLDWAVQGQPDLVIVALGANDGLRGIDPADTRRNLAAILERLKQRDVPAMLAGMLAPPNMGADYGKAFNAIYPDLSESEGVPLYPFLLDGVAAEPALNQDDGMHPNAEGAKLIAERLAGPVAAALDQE
ncbi:MAG: arylesterase [Minwuia sp.]|uniref:arylesterase n=1 Tax=Minwuia sp. TaxID=2493630 RepID=UPI003A854745